MWKVLRALYLAFLWILGPAIGWYAVRQWHAHPGKFIGVAWIAFVLAAVVAMVLSTLGITIEIVRLPLPPAVTQTETLGRWAYYLFAEIATSIIFAVDVGIGLIAAHIVSWDVDHYLQPLGSYWQTYIEKILLFLLIIGWIIGTLFLLAWLQGLDITTRLRKQFLRAFGAAYSTPDIVELLKKSDLPASAKSTFLHRIRKEGLDVGLAREMLKVMEDSNPPDSAKERIAHSNLHAALAAWIEQHER